ITLIGSRRYLLVRDWPPLTAGAKGKDDGMMEALEALIEGLSPDVCLVFESAAVDRRTALVKRLEKAAVTVHCEPIAPKDVNSWLIRRAAERGQRLSQPAAALLRDRVGTDLLLLERELEKSLLHAGGTAPVGPADVEAVVSGEGQWRIFDVLDAVGEKRTADAVRALRRLFDTGEPPLRSLTMISRHVRQLWQAGLLIRAGHDVEGVRKRLKVHAFVAKKCVSQARAFSDDELFRALEACHETDVAIKTGLRPPELAVELLVVRLAGGRSGHAGDARYDRAMNTR
ncbi:MAG: DNA polymerase III subunit delta, partial [Thermaerobacterales bacterium]